MVKKTLLITLLLSAIFVQIGCNSGGSTEPGMAKQNVAPTDNGTPPPTNAPVNKDADGPVGLGQNDGGPGREVLGEGH